DFVLDVLYACATIAMHLSRLSEETILWATGEFRFLELSDAFTTGSSIMPQKKNPDVAELARGKTGRVYGDLLAMLTVAKGLPLTYNKDFQEDKEALFDAVDTALAVLDVFPPMMRSARFDIDRLAVTATADFSLATDAADLLARNGVPFREAHETVGRLVQRCIAEGRAFADLTDAEWADIHPVFASQRPPRTAAESVASRDVPGGVAPRRVAAALQATDEALAEDRAWLEARRSERERLLARPAEAAK
ncbi:MAG TPA: lyase family protein, partial [Thermomicrobiales bacterium]|nr:lyase family protein [Thermomicrobiales bacterium]